MLPKARITLRSRFFPGVRFLEAAGLIEMDMTEQKKWDDHKVLQLLNTLTLILLPALMGKDLRVI